MQDADSQNEAGWQPIETAPIDVTILMGYFGEVENLHGAVVVGHFFHWDKMPARLATGWHFSAPPTHWSYLPTPFPMLSERMKDRS